MSSFRLSTQVTSSSTSAASCASLTNTTNLVTCSANTLADCISGQEEQNYNGNNFSNIEFDLTITTAVNNYYPTHQNHIINQNPPSDYFNQNQSNKLESFDTTFDLDSNNNNNNYKNLSSPLCTNPLFSASCTGKIFLKT